MKKFIISFLFGILIFVSGFIVSRFILKEPRATIIVSNNSTKTLSRVFIQTTDSTTYFIQNIREKTSEVVRIYVRGENGYILKVYFQNGDSLLGGAGYIETGYTVKEIVSDSVITSKYESLYAN